MYVSMQTLSVDEYDFGETSTFYEMELDPRQFTQDPTVAVTTFIPTAPELLINGRRHRRLK